MTSMRSEWPGFGDVPLEEIPIHRPQTQELAPWIWWDGHIRAAEDQSVHFYSNALHYGTAVFEGIRLYPTASGPALFRAREHMERLHASAKLYGMMLRWDAEELTLGAAALAARTGMEHVYLRPLAFYGRGPIDLNPRRECPVHVFIAVRGLGAFLGESALRHGARLTVSSWRRVPHSCLPMMAKASGHYANNVLAAQEALDRGYDDALLLNADGTVSCATGMNVFLVQRGTLITNDESASIVPGITRDTVLHLARREGVPVEIRPFTREQLLRSDEVFLTGTAAELTPVREVEGIEFPTGRGTVAASLQRAYLRLVSGRDPAPEGWLHMV